MSGVFEGLKVLDFTNNVAGPCCTALLADMGAEVVKIERPVAGDDSRGVSPRVEGQSLQFIWYNRGKKSVELALDDPDVQKTLRKMVADVDVVVESFKPGKMKKFGLDYESLAKVNPSIIYCSVSACGQTGGYSNEPGFDVIAQGMSGLMDMCGDPGGAPVKQGVCIGDYVGSFNAFSGIAVALYHRLKTGEGQYIDISLLDGLLSCNTTLENAATLGAHPTRSGRHHATMAPYGIFLGKNGQSVIIAAYTSSMWSKFCNSVGMPELIDDPRLSSIPLRAKNIAPLVDIIEAWLQKFEDINDAITILKAGGVACCKIRSTFEVANDPILWERGSLVEIPTQPSFKELKKIRARGPWIRLSKTPAVMHRAPDLGEHTYEIMNKYGWDRNMVDAKKENWSSKFKKQ